MSSLFKYLKKYIVGMWLHACFLEKKKISYNYYTSSDNEEIHTTSFGHDSFNISSFLEYRVYIKRYIIYPFTINILRSTP